MDDEVYLYDEQPISEIYKDIFDKLKHETQEEFKPLVAIDTIATVHTSKVKDYIDENMSNYDERKLKDIVERSVAKYVTIED